MSSIGNFGRLAPVAGLILAACSGGEEARTADAGGAMPAAVDTERLVALVDSRIRLALARERALRDDRSGRSRLAALLEGAAGVARSAPPAPATGGSGTDGPAGASGLAERLASLSERVAGLEDGGPGALDDLREEVRGTRDELTAYAELDGAVANSTVPGTYAGWKGEEPDFAPHDEGVGELSVLDAVDRNLERALSVLDRVGQARAALEEIVSGEMPESGPYGDEYYGAYAYEEPYADYDDFAWEDDEAWRDDDYARESDTDAEAAGGATASDGGPVARVEHRSVPGLEVQILALRRGPGELVTLEVAVVNGSDATVQLDRGHLFGVGGPYRWGLRDAGLVDLLTGDRFEVIRDSEGNCVCSAGGYSDRDVGPGERRRLQARFADVPREVGNVSVDLSEGFPLIDGLTITG